MEFPRIRVRVQSDDEPGAYPRLSDWWDGKDAAAIRMGRMELYVIEILDSVGRVMTDVSNRLGFSGYAGVYNRPGEIREMWLEYWAADHWTPCFGIEPGDLIYHAGDVLTVINFEQIDQDYGDIGANTGFLVCQHTNHSGRRLIWIEQAVKVKEITA